MSLLSLCTNVANNAGIAPPASLIGNTDPAAARLLQMARSEARNLARRANWAALTIENIFVANGTSDYVLPPDFRSIIGDTVWDRAGYWSMRGALSPQQWQRYRSSNLGNISIRRRWRLKLPPGDPAGARVAFEIDPPIHGDLTSTFVYEYVSKFWCLSVAKRQVISVVPVNGGANYAIGDTITLDVPGAVAAPVLTVVSIGIGGGLIWGSGSWGSNYWGGTYPASSVEITTPGSTDIVPVNPVGQLSTSGAGTGATFNLTWGPAAQSDWAADGDTALIDEELIELGVLWRTMRRLGFAYDEEKEEYERLVDLAVAQDGGTAIIDLVPSSDFFWPGAFGGSLGGNFPGTVPAPQPSPADISVFMPGLPGASEIVNVGFTRFVTFAAGLPGSFATAITAATATVVIGINQVSGMVSTLRGTVTMLAGETVGVLSLPATITLSPGDELSFAFPASPDATLADVTIALQGTQT